MHSVKNLFGKRIKELRKQKNLTQEQLAELVDMDTRNIIKIENAQTFPRVKTLDKILEVFDVLKEKIYEKLDKDDELVRLIYKMLF